MIGTIDVRYTSTEKHLASVTHAEYVQLQHRVGHRLIENLFLANGFNEKISDTRIARGPYGKPYIPNRPHFSISHSNHIVVAALYIYSAVGIDIEHHQSITPEFRGVFNEEELLKINASATPHDYALEQWVKKESIAKGDGRGLQIPFTTIALNDNTGRISGETGVWYVHVVPIDNHYCYVSCEDLITTVTVQNVQV